MADISPEQLVRCARPLHVSGLNIPERRLGRLIGVEFPATVVSVPGDNIASVSLSVIVATLEAVPITLAESFYWRGLRDAHQPSFYGVTSSPIPDRTLVFGFSQEFCSTSW